ncbi:MAG: methyltransferase [Woeseiaceae bacterium]
MTSEKTIPGLWAGQWLHGLCLIPLLVATYFIWIYLGAPFPLAFWIAVAVPIVHQVFVWLAWRFELSTSSTSRTIGFKGYIAGFFLLFSGRFVSLFLLAWLDCGSLHMPGVLQIGLTGVMTLLGVYTMYSVMRYFGPARASGADHFDARYRDMPLVKEGIFRYTSNGMYIYAFLLFWAIALGFASSAALAVAAFSHAYIWVHFYATEKPDMEFLYGSR